MDRSSPWAGVPVGIVLHYRRMPQLLLIPDPKPLVERLGPDFFRRAPAHPGVYLMRDAADAVLYVGKAKNLRKRLASYRVANPQRLKRRHLRLLRSVARIDFEACPDESSALAREAELLRQLRPRFNRAGVWPGPPRFLAWRVSTAGLELAIMPGAEPGWSWHGPMGAGAVPLRAVLVRLLWRRLTPERGLAGMPEGWFSGRFGGVPVIGTAGDGEWNLMDAAKRLIRLVSGEVEPFAQWIRDDKIDPPHPFDAAVIEADLETITNMFLREPVTAVADRA